MTDLSTWLTKPDAAARLGISERTLDRRTIDGGNLGPERRERPRPGLKPEPVFNPEDVLRLSPIALDLSGWITKPDAARSLGISERTLDRRCDAGEGPERRERSRTGMKPEPVFNPDDVERLAAPRAHVMPAQSAALSPLPIPTSADALSMVLDRIAAAVENRLGEARPEPLALYLDLRQASDYTGLSLAFLRRLIADGKLPAVRDRAIKVARRDLDNLSVLAESSMVAK
jgi:excisionase family DNA binding protein